MPTPCWGLLAVANNPRMDIRPYVMFSGNKSFRGLSASDWLNHWIFRRYKTLFTKLGALRALLVGVTQRTSLDTWEECSSPSQIYAAIFGNEIRWNPQNVVSLHYGEAASALLPELNVYTRRPA